MADAGKPKVLAFDVFGTVVDWRSSIIAESAAFLTRIGRPDLDPAAFTDAWRGRYLRVMTAYAASGREFTPLDVLHREMLDQTLESKGVDPAVLDDALLQDWRSPGVGWRPGRTRSRG